MIIKEINLWGAGVCTGITVSIVKTNLTWAIVMGVIALVNYLAYFKQAPTNKRAFP